MTRSVHGVFLTACLALTASWALAGPPMLAKSTPPPGASPAAKAPAPGAPAPAAAVAPAPAPAKFDPLKDGTHVGWLTLRGPLRESQPKVAMGGHGGGPGTLEGFVRQLNTIASDPKYKGVVLELDGAATSLSQIAAIEPATAKIRATGKKVLVYARNYSMAEYVLACMGDMILLGEKGEIGLEGISVEEMYLAGTLEKVGVKADFVQVGKFKGAEEQFTRKGPSQFWSETFDKLLDDLYAQLIERIAAGRRVDKAKVQGWFKDAWTQSDVELLKARVVDHLVDSQLKDVVNKRDIAVELFGDRLEWDEEVGQTGMSLPMDNPLAMFQLLLQGRKEAIRRPTIVVIHMDGPIHDGESGSEGPFESASIGSRTILETLRECADEENIKGVVLRMDSPGGSAAASETIWQGVRELMAGDGELAHAKPVYASVGGMAASGGYYIACAADEIYVSPSSILGSIGVITGKMTFSGLYDWAGVGIHSRSRGAAAEMFNSTAPFTAEQRETIRKVATRIYDQFTGRVKDGRGKRLKAPIADVAQGRLFTGRVAVENGLADKVGAVDVAIADLAAKLKLKEGEYDVVHRPTPPSFGEMLERMFQATAPVSPAASVPATQREMAMGLRSLLGEARWRQVSAHVQGLMLLRKERSLLLMPNPVIVK